MTTESVEHEHSEHVEVTETTTNIITENGETRIEKTVTVERTGEEPQVTTYTTYSHANGDGKAYEIPYRSRLTEKITPGQVLTIKGVIPDKANRFTINLHKDSPDFSGNDVPLHLSVRFDEGRIVFNTFTSGAWGKEERQKNPLKHGHDFDLRIRAHENKFSIYADRKLIKEYDHRIPLQSVTHLSIDGEAKISSVTWGGKYYAVPYETGIAGEGLPPGKRLVVTAFVDKKSKAIVVNLLKKNGDIALHFNPRFNEKAGFACLSPGGGAVIRNALINSQWGNEEREGKSPFEKNTLFDLEILNEEFAFQIFVNGARFATFAHRTDAFGINGLQVQGDLEIIGMQIL